jgi:hypothetical protein
MLISLLASLCGLGVVSAPKEGEAAMARGRTVAVVELFTSEGCSSCPPADALLTKLIAEHEAAGDLVALSFHVDYWDNLGWKDPWSSAAATARQRWYADQLGSSLYTPQMVVNGKDEFVGSDSGRARVRLDAALRHAPQWSVTVDVQNGAKADEIRVEASATRIDGAAAKEPVYVVAIVERGLSSKVRRGENAGRTLTHDNVVRVFEAFDPDAKTRVIRVPSDVKRENASVVVLAQEASGAVVAARQIGLPEKEDGRGAPEKAPVKDDDPSSQ